MDKIEKDNKNFIDEIKNIKNNNIINQLVSYDINDTEYFIKNIESELEQQMTLNNILKKKEFKKEIENIESYINKNSNKIDEQYNKLIKLSENLKEIIIENNNIQEKQKELKSITESYIYKDLAMKMKEIKKNKEDIKIFLEKNDIISLI